MNYMPFKLPPHLDGYTGGGGRTTSHTTNSADIKAEVNLPVGQICRDNREGVKKRRPTFSNVISAITRVCQLTMGERPYFQKGGCVLGQWVINEDIKAKIIVQPKYF